MPKEEWFIFLDFLFTFNEHPELLYIFTSSYILYFRNDLLKIRKPADMSTFIYWESAFYVWDIMDFAF